MQDVWCVTPMKGSFISRGLRITDLDSCEWSPVSEFLLLGHDLCPLNLKELCPSNVLSIQCPLKLKNCVLSIQWLVCLLCFSTWEALAKPLHSPTLPPDTRWGPASLSRGYKPPCDASKEVKYLKSWLTSPTIVVCLLQQCSLQSTSP